MTTSKADSVDVVRSFYEQGGPAAEPEVLRSIFAEDYVSHTAPPGSAPGPEQAIGLRAFLLSAFTDVGFRVLRIVSEGQFVAVHAVLSGTHTGPLFGVEPTGRTVEVEQMHFIRVDQGKIVEHWGVRDDLGMMRHLQNPAG